jgi:hypothetical protein
METPLVEQIVLPRVSFYSTCVLMVLLALWFKVAKRLAIHLDQQKLPKGSRAHRYTVFRLLRERKYLWRYVAAVLLVDLVFSVVILVVVDLAGPPGQAIFLIAAVLAGFLNPSAILSSEASPGAGMSDNGKVARFISRVASPIRSILRSVREFEAGYLKLLCEDLADANAALEADMVREVVQDYPEAELARFLAEHAKPGALDIPVDDNAASFAWIHAGAMQVMRKEGCHTPKAFRRRYDRIMNRDVIQGTAGHRDHTMLALPLSSILSRCHLSCSCCTHWSAAGPQLGNCEKGLRRMGDGGPRPPWTAFWCEEHVCTSGATPAALHRTVRSELAGRMARAGHVA